MMAESGAETRSEILNQIIQTDLWKMNLYFKHFTYYETHYKLLPLQSAIISPIHSL